MSNAAPSRTRRDETAKKTGTCDLCRRRVGRSAVVWDHCHECGRFRGWLCQDCNTAISVHIANYWKSATAYIEQHECVPAMQLFDTKDAFDSKAASTREAGVTRSLFLSNGGGDGRYVKVSNIAGWLTAEQYGVMLGVNANTARDLMSGRQTGRPTGKKHGDTWLVHVSDAIAELERRYG